LLGLASFLMGALASVLARPAAAAFYERMTGTVCVPQHPANYSHGYPYSGGPAEAEAFVLGSWVCPVPNKTDMPLELITEIKLLVHDANDNGASRDGVWTAYPHSNNTGSTSGTGSTSSTGGASNTPGGGNNPSGGNNPGAGNGPVGMAGSGSGGTPVGAGGMGGPSKPIWPDGRGPSVAFKTYEAEAMDTNGTKTVPTRAFSRISGESSGRQAVTLSQTGHQVAFMNAEAANSIVVRYSMPDNGHDLWTTLSVFVDGESRGKLNLTSRYSWTYGGDALFNQPGQEDKGAGNEHHFYDEAHALIGDVPVGATVILPKAADDSAASYTIDLVEMEQVGGPLPMPENFVSIRVWATCSFRAFGRAT
jgi:hypothetical protein